MKVTNRYVWLLVAVALLLALFAAVQVSAAPTPQEEAPTPPGAVLEFQAWPANSRLTTNVLTTTITVITDTAVGPTPRTIGQGTTGLSVVPVGLPVIMEVSSEDAAAKVVTYTWSFVGKPADSKAAFPKDSNVALLSFEPDVPGAYMVSARLTYDDKTQSEPAFATVRAATFVGMTAGKCDTCHPGQAEEWAETGHATIFMDEIDNTRTPDVPTHYAETCAVCHTVGFYADPYTGTLGFKDAAVKEKWVFPTFKQIDAGGNWAKVPASVKNMSNIQCENCHGPASEHIAGKAPPATSMDNGNCNVCHNGGGHHNKGEMLKNAGHSDETSVAWTEPVGPGEQACVRCHSGAGYVTFLEEPTNPAAWDNSMQTVGCSTCHDPHSDAITWQLRIAGKPVQVPFEPMETGLSATCVECHNGRTKPADAIDSRFPHYSSAAEMIYNVGGVTYGKTPVDSPHGMLVGAQAVNNPAAAEDPEAAKWLFTPAAATAGTVPGACVVCHMWPTEEDAESENYLAVGGHSFNMAGPTDEDYTASCKSCHGDIEEFDLTAKADYDGNGETEGVQEEVKGMLDVLWGALEEAGVKKVETGYPYATLPKGADGKTDDKIENAYFNFRTVYGVMWGEETGDGNQGACAAIHNFKRSIWLLQQSYQDLTGDPVPDATMIQ